jgi:hypothetical protein
VHQYDVAAKVLLENCRDELIRRFLGMDVAESVLLEELPQETVSLKRSDFPVQVTGRDGNSRIVALELQSWWNNDLPLHLLDYRTRYRLKYRLEVISCVVLLRPSSAATNRFSDNEVDFRFRLVRIPDFDAEEILREDIPCLLPFVPLMKNGPEHLLEADNRIYESPVPRSQKSDMLTSMAILSGLVSHDLTTQLIQRRRDIMIESPAYEIFRKEWMKEGLQEGLLKGRNEVVREGLKPSLQALLEIKFGAEGLAVYSQVENLDRIELLQELVRVIKDAKTPGEVRQFIAKAS